MNTSPDFLPDPDENVSQRKKNTLPTREARISSEYVRRERELVEKARAITVGLPRKGINSRGLLEIVAHPDIEISEGGIGGLDICTANARLGGIGNAVVNLDTNDFQDTQLAYIEDYPYRLQVGVHMDQATMEAAKEYLKNDTASGWDFITTYYFREEDGEIVKLSTVPYELVGDRGDLVRQSSYTATFPSPMTPRDFEMAVAAIGSLEEKINALSQAKKE